MAIPPSSLVPRGVLLLTLTTAVACTATRPTRETGPTPARVAATAPSGYVRLPPPGRFEIRLTSRRFTPPEEKPNWKELLARTEAPRARAIVQLAELPDRHTRAALAQAGVVLGQPLTGRAYLATVKRRLDESASALRAIRWVGSLGAEDKISPELARPDGAPWARRTPGRIELVVKLFPDADIASVAARVQGFGGRVLGQAVSAKTLAVSLPAGRERDLATQEDVRLLEPLLPPGQGESDRARVHVRAVAGAIPAGSPNGTGAVVAVFDGEHVRANHPDFGARAAQGDGPPQALGQHATMTAGIIAGDGSQSVAGGAASANQWRGLAPGAQIRSYNFLNSGGDPVTDYLDDVTEAVTNDGVHVLNNSWGDSGCTNFAYGSYAGRAPFLDGVTHGDLGSPAAVVFAAGNERDGIAGSNDTSCLSDTAAPFANYTTINHPKGAKNVLLVGAVDSANNSMSGYSSWGPTLDGRLKPDVVASGQHNGTMTSEVSVIDNPFGNPVGAANQQGYRVPNHPTNQFIYAWFSQTSSAAAITSGSLGLLINAWQTTFPGRPDPLPSTLRALTVHNAEDLDDSTTWFNPGPDYASGYGLIRVDASLQSVQRREAVEGSVNQGETARFFLTIPAGATEVKVTLAWDDPPALENADPALINDLDLVVRDPSGTRHFPWTLDPANPTANAVRNAEDHVNNLEQVVVNAGVTPGTWEVDIVGTAVAAGPQSFSVVAQNGPVRRPVDLILALDTSDSMNGSASSGAGALTKIALLRQAVTLFLETWQLHAVAGDRVGLATFSDNVATIPNTVPALQPFLPNFASITNDVGSLTASGCTAMGGALQVAFDSFDQASPNKKALLLFTDGMQSTNPFVGEAGNPPRLRIQSFAANATLPFGAFFCTSATATGPSGAAIAPDGQNVDQHGAEAHTIGVGVNGAGFQQVLQRLGDETRGVHHFTTEPDANLDLFYTNDLVQALKSNTLEVIVTDAGTLGSGATKDVAFPVNATTRSITAVISWRGANQVGAVPASMTGPGGTVLTPDQIRQQGFFTLLKFDLPGGHGAIPGTWHLLLSRASRVAVKYQVSILSEDSCLHYDLRAEPGPHRVGQPLRLEARLSAWGRAAGLPSLVRVTISLPSEPTPNLLAQWLPRTRAVRRGLARRVAPGTARPAAAISTAAILESGFEELLRTSAFLARLRRRETVEVVLTASGDGFYTGLIPRLLRPGSYDLLWRIEGATACGPILRQEISTLLVFPANVDPVHSPVTPEPGRPGTGTVTITVRPADAEGNLLGPGLAGKVSITSEKLKAVGGVVDRLDGTYAQVFAGDAKAALPVTVTVDGRSWTVLPSSKSVR